jgi:hypothetical protein
MLARDGPQNTPILGPIEPPPLGPKTAPKKVSQATRAKAPVKSSKTKAKAPKEKRSSRPPNSGGYVWRKDGAGWELRKTVYVEDGTGSKVRKRPYVARMAKAVFQDMKRKHKGGALEKAIAAWIEDHDR